MQQSGAEIFTSNQSKSKYALYDTRHEATRLLNEHASIALTTRSADEETALIEFTAGQQPLQERLEALHDDLELSYKRLSTSGVIDVTVQVEEIPTAHSGAETVPGVSHWHPLTICAELLHHTVRVKGEDECVAADLYFDESAGKATAHLHLNVKNVNTEHLLLKVVLHDSSALAVPVQHRPAIVTHDICLVQLCGGSGVYTERLYVPAAAIQRRDGGNKSSVKPQQQSQHRPHTATAASRASTRGGSLYRVFARKRQELMQRGVPPACVALKVQIRYVPS